MSEKIGEYFVEDFTPVWKVSTENMAYYCRTFSLTDREVCLVNALEINTPMSSPNRYPHEVMIIGGQVIIEKIDPKFTIKVASRPPAETS